MPCFDNEWFYEELERYKPEISDIKKSFQEWFETHLGMRWQGQLETFWTKNRSCRASWQKLYQRFPPDFAQEIAYLSNFILDFLEGIHPSLDTLLAQHGHMEWLLYADLGRDNYREHIVHPCKVAVLAHWLLDKSGKTEKIRCQLSKSKQITKYLQKIDCGITSQTLFEGKQGKSIIKAAMWLAGIFHDIGYPYQFMCDLEKQMCQIYPFYTGDITSNSLQKLPWSLKNGISLIDCHLNEGQLPDGCRKDRKSKSELNMFGQLPSNYSMAGAIAFLCLLDQVIDQWQDVAPAVLVTFELAAEAIYYHDILKINNSDEKPLITFTKHPLAVILALADEIQDWGRPRTIYEPNHAKDEITIKYNADDSVKFAISTEDSFILQLKNDIVKKITEKRLAYKGLMKITELAGA